MGYLTKSNKVCWLLRSAQTSELLPLVQFGISTSWSHRFDAFYSDLWGRQALLESLGASIHLLSTMCCLSAQPPLLGCLNPVLRTLQVDLAHVEHFIKVIGAYEDQIFQKRARLLQRQKQRRDREQANNPR